MTVLEHDRVTGNLVLFVGQTDSYQGTDPGLAPGPTMTDSPRIRADAIALLSRGKWALLLIPPIVAALVYSTGERKTSSVWSGAISVQIGQMPNTNALLFNPSHEPALAPIETSRELVIWLASRESRAAINTKLADPDRQLVNATLRGIATGDRVVRIEFAGLSQQRAEEALKLMTDAIAERHRGIMGQRKTLVDGVLTEYRQRLESLTERDPVLTSPQAPDRIIVVGSPPARWDGFATALYANMQRLRILNQLSEPTLVLDAPTAVSAPRQPDRLFHSLLIGSLILFGVVLIIFWLSRRSARA